LGGAKSGKGRMSGGVAREELVRFRDRYGGDGMAWRKVHSGGGGGEVGGG
jgi:hypothetical protein